MADVADLQCKAQRLAHTDQRAHAPHHEDCWRRPRNEPHAAITASQLNVSQVVDRPRTLGAPSGSSERRQVAQFCSGGNTSFTHVRIGRSGRLSGTKSSSRTVVNKLSLYPSAPRMALALLGLLGAHARSGEGGSREVFQRPAKAMQWILPSALRLVIAKTGDPVSDLIFWLLWLIENAPDADIDSAYDLSWMTLGQRDALMCLLNYLSQELKEDSAAAQQSLRVLRFKS